MSDAFQSLASGLDSPGLNAAEITPDDGANLTNFSRALWIGDGGNVRVTMIGGQTVTFSNVAQGTLLPIRVSRVWATGTTATLIDAVW
jgi:hypothetical protein